MKSFKNETVAWELSMHDRLLMKQPLSIDPLMLCFRNFNQQCHGQ